MANRVCTRTRTESGTATICKDNDDGKTSLKAIPFRMRTGSDRHLGTRIGKGHRKCRVCRNRLNQCRLPFRQARLEVRHARLAVRHADELAKDIGFGFALLLGYGWQRPGLLQSLPCQQTGTNETALLYHLLEVLHFC